MLKASDVNNGKNHHQSAIRLSTFSMIAWVVILGALVYSFFVFEAPAHGVIVITCHGAAILFALINIYHYAHKRKLLIKSFEKTLYD